MTTRTCATCDGPLSAKSKYVHQCGRCAKSRLQLARMDRHVYARTHVHRWPDGRKTIELGTRCAQDALVVLTGCLRWGEDEGAVA